MKRKGLCLISAILIAISLSACTTHDVAKLAGIRESDAELSSGINDRNLERVKEALEDGANINKIKISLVSEENPVILALTKNNNQNKIAEYLIEKGADVNYSDGSGRSLLMFSAYNTDASFCKFLIDHGAKIDTEDKQGYTALEYVLEHSTRGTTEKNMDNIVTMFLEHGAKIRPITLKAAMKSERESKYGLINRIMKELIKSGYNSELNPVLEEAILGESLKINELINNNQMKQEDKQQILFYTAAFGSVETMKILEDNGIDINVIDKFKNSTFIIASEYGNLEMVKYLLNKGLNIQARNIDNESALFVAIRNEQYDIAKYLINQGADIKPSDKNDILVESCKNGDIDMLKLIMANGYPLSEKNRGKAMEAACRSRKINVVEYLLDMGANPDLECLQSIEFRDSEGLDIAKLLVKRGAKVNGKNSDGSPLKFIDSKEISEYLIEKGANVNEISTSKSDNKGESILMSIMANGDLDKIKLLVENGADLEYQNENANKDTAIIWAAEQPSWHILEYVIQNGADMNYQNEKCETALMRAVSRGYLSNVKILIKYKADVSLKDKEGRTALDIAEAKNYKEITSYLKDVK